MLFGAQKRRFLSLPDHSASSLHDHHQTGATRRELHPRGCQRLVAGLGAAIVAVGVTGALAVPAAASPDTGSTSGSTDAEANSSGAGQSSRNSDGPDSESSSTTVGSTNRTSSYGSSSGNSDSQSTSTSAEADSASDPETSDPLDMESGDTSAVTAADDSATPEEYAAGPEGQAVLDNEVLDNEVLDNEALDDEEAGASSDPDVTEPEPTPEPPSESEASEPSVEPSETPEPPTDTAEGSEEPAGSASQTDPAVDQSPSDSGSTASDDGSTSSEGPVDTAALESAAQADNEATATSEATTDDPTDAAEEPTQDIDEPTESIDAATAVAPAANTTHSPPTPQEFVAQVQAQIHSTINTIKQRVSDAVTTCLCNVFTQVLAFVDNAGNTLNPPSSTGGGTPQPNNPAMWAVAAWVRKQADNAVSAFNRSPVGAWLRETASQAEQAFDDLGNSPLGRTFSAQLTAFLEQCGDSTELSSDLERTTIISGLTEPTDFELIADPDDPDQVGMILVAEKSGAIKAYDPHTGSLTTLINLNVVTADGERGLLGLEVDPNFWDSDQEGYHTVYAAYTNVDNYDQLSSFTMSESLDSLGNEHVMVVSTLQAHEFHHGGELEFDPEGQHLYWAVGNNTALTNSQDLSNIHGKILRLNRDGTPAEDNPFIGEANPNTQLIYAYGLRNPFRFAFAPDGTLLAGDVGEASWEELNVIVPEGNYGWPYAEGTCDGCGYLNPLYAYPHSEVSGSGSITSVLVYSGDALGSQYTNKVFIADYSLGWIREITVDEQYSSVIDVRTFDASAGTVVKLAEGPEGYIYQLDIYPGALSVIAPSGGNRAPTAVIDASATSTAADSLTVEFSGEGSSDPDFGDAVTYRWDFGNGTTSTEANPTATFTKVTGADYTAFTVTLTVSDGEKTNQTTERIVVGSTPPAATISVSDTKYNAGDTLTFSATANDDQDGSLPEDAYDWTVEFHHLDHKHPFLNDISGSTGTMTVPTNTDQLDTTFYRVILTVTDSSGLSSTQYVDVTPNLVELTFGANDPNATYTLDGVPRKGTYTEQGVVGVVRTIGAVSPQTVDGQVLVFDSWSDGGAATHTITAPSTETTYTVTYTPAQTNL